MSSTSYFPLDSALQINLLKDLSIFALSTSCFSALHVDFYQQSFMGGALTKDIDGSSFTKFGGFFFSFFILLNLIRGHLSPVSCLKHSIPNLYDITPLFPLGLTISLLLSSDILQHFVLRPFFLVLDITSLGNLICECNYQSYVDDSSIVIAA